MALDQCAIVYVSANAAKLALYVGGERTPITHIYHVYGDRASADAGYTSYTLLPGISIHGIIQRLNNPQGKHTTFSSSGNKFSRVASVVQAGYAGAVAQASVSSGVRFRWTAEDLLKYCHKWKEHLRNDLKQTNAECEEAFRFLKPRLDVYTPCIDHYTFVSDTEIEVVTEASLLATQERAVKEHMAKHMVNF